MTPYEEARIELAKRELARRKSIEPVPGLVEKYAVPAGAIAGGIGGAFVGSPILGSAIGTSVGKTVENISRQQRTKKPIPFGEVLGGQAAAVGTDLALGGAATGLFKGGAMALRAGGRIKRAIPFLRSAKAAPAAERIFMKSRKVAGQAMEEYGKQLSEAGVKVPTGSFLPEVLDVSTDPTIAKSVERAITKYDFTFKTNLRELADSLPDSVSASEAQHLSNALSDVAPSVSRSIRQGISDAIPEEFAGIKSAYAQSMRDVDVLKAGVTRNLFRGTEKIGTAYKDPNFREVFKRRLPEEAGTAEKLSTAQSIKDFPSKIIPWIRRNR